MTARSHKSTDVPTAGSGAVNCKRQAWATAAAAFAAVMLSWPTASSAQSPLTETSVAGPTASAIAEFYHARAWKPLWFGATSDDAAQQLLRLLATAEADGIGKGQFELGSLLLAVREASKGDSIAVRRAEIMLSEAFVAYARQLQRDPKVGVIYVDSELKPTPSSAASLLEAAAKAPSLDSYVRKLVWMNPLYAELREALVARHYTSERGRYLLIINLERARALPPAKGRYVLVNTANQRLYMYEGDKIVDEMRVVAGRLNAQTPLMNAFIRFAVINPYWNVPTDLVARLAPNVVKRGRAYLLQQGYEAVSDFGVNPRMIDPDTIDWKAVAAGKLAVQLRQLPGPANSMGRVKFMFPNTQGVWLHDTPSKELFAKDVRLESAGCIRLEDAWRLGSWLFQRPLKATTDEPERQVELPAPVPIFITYLTAIPRKGAIHYVEDAYRRDDPRLVTKSASDAATTKGLQP